MARVGFIFEATFSDSNDSVQDPDLVRPSAAFAKASTNLDFKRLSRCLLQLVKILVVAKGREIVPMDNTCVLDARKYKARLFRIGNQLFPELLCRCPPR